MVLHGVDDDQHVSEFSGDNPSTVVSGMFRPNDVDFIIAQVSKLKRKRTFERDRKRVEKRSTNYRADKTRLFVN